MKVNRIDILGTPVDCVTMQGAVAAANEIIRNGSCATSILAVNPEKIITAQKDPEIASALRNAALCIPDGIGVVVAAKLMGKKSISRVPGSELMPELCSLAANNGYSIYLFGGKEHVCQKAAVALTRKYPGLRVAGRDNGYLKKEQYPELVERINRSGAQILFVALGSPRQERWIETYKHQLKTVRICQGVGGTFDVIAGEVKRAPAFFRALNLEWAYRLATQPTRIRRQAALPVFTFRFLSSLLFRSKSQ